MEKKQTAVDWLIEQVKSKEWQDMFIWHKEEVYKQAKEKEREQIMTAFTQGDIFGSDYFDGVNITEENYYNKTFKSE